MKTKWLMASLLAAVLTACNGCILLGIGVVAAAAGGVVYVNGELKETDGVPYDRAYNAALAGLNDLQYGVETKTKDAIEAKIVAHNAAGTKIWVTLEKQSATSTQFIIRVGVAGDRKASQQILDKIKSHF